MHESASSGRDLLPDFIVVDGAEGGTGAAPAEFIDHIGVPMHEALLLVHNTLVGIGLRDRVRVAAAGKITSAFDIARTLALGADWCNAGRGYMFALGCIQSLSCHSDRCPTGIATQNPNRWKHLDPADKAVRVHNFHDNTLRALRDLLCAAAAWSIRPSWGRSTSCAGSRRWKSARWRRCTATCDRASCCRGFPNTRSSTTSGPRRAAMRSSRRRVWTPCAGASAEPFDVALQLCLSHMCT